LEAIDAELDGYLETIPESSLETDSRQQITQKAKTINHKLEQIEECLSSVGRMFNEPKHMDPMGNPIVCHCKFVYTASNRAFLTKIKWFLCRLMTLTKH